MDYEKITQEFFKRRFPEKDIQFEKDCGYFQTWKTRLAGGSPEGYMDDISLKVWEQMKTEGKPSSSLLSKEQYYKCVYCGKVFYKIKNLFKHNSICNQQRKYDLEETRRIINNDRQRNKE